jgi:hypothetical protein
VTHPHIVQVEPGTGSWSDDRAMSKGVAAVAEPSPARIEALVIIRSVQVVVCSEDLANRP